MELIEKMTKITNLEERLDQQSTEYSFELEHARKMQSLELQKTCEKYDKIISQLNNDRDALEKKYHEEKNLLNSVIEQKDIEHSTQMIQMEAKLCEKILNESNKSAELKSKMDNLKEEYEKLLRKSSDCLQATIDTLEKRFNEQLHERENQIRSLMDEIQTKKEEFFHYCKQLNLDNERRIAQLNLKHEIRLKETNDLLFKWRTDASILTKKNDATARYCEQLKNDIGILLDENNRNKKYICQLEQNIYEFQREIDLRNKLVDDKEICLIQALDKISNMETLKKFLNERAIELESQIQPLNEQIKQYNLKIDDMEECERNLRVKIENLNIDISGLNDRRKVISNDLKFEKNKVLCLETLIDRICADIYEMVENSQDISKLRQNAFCMYKKYANFESFNN